MEDWGKELILAKFLELKPDWMPLVPQAVLILRATYWQYSGYKLSFDIDSLDFWYELSYPKKSFKNISLMFL